VTGTSTKVGTGKGGGIKANQTGPITGKTSGKVNVKYTIVTTQTPSSTGAFRLHGNVTENVSAEGMRTLSGVAGSSSSTLNKRTALGSLNPLWEYNIAPPARTGRMTIPFGNTTWTTVSGGKSAVAAFPLGDNLIATYKLTHTGGGNTATVGSASGACNIEFTPTKVDFNRGVVAVSVLGTTQSYLPEISVDIYTANNVFVDTWTILSDSSVGDVELPFEDYANGTYNLYVYGLGALRKKVQVQYANGTGVSGVDFGLKFGDLNGDNYVSSAEVLFVYNNIGSSVNTTDLYLGDWWSDLQNGYVRGFADFDRDGTITSTDYNLANANVGTYGD
jgi:hypothetical protein